MYTRAVIIARPSSEIDMAIQNRTALLDHGVVDLRRVALDVVDAGLSAADPKTAVMSALSVQDNILLVDGRRYDLRDFRRIRVIGAGKASLAIVEGVSALLGERIDAGVVVVPRGHARPVQRVEVLEADHPLPSEFSIAAAERLVALAEDSGADDLIISCVTGGSSSLVCLPPPGVTLSEKRELHRQLITSGADIQAINAVRKHVSLIKGGRLAQLASPAHILNLTVSDVAGDIVEYITDLTVQNSEPPDRATAVLKRFDLWDTVPQSIRTHLASPSIGKLPDLSDTDIHTVLLITGDTVCSAMARAVEKTGFRPVVLSTTLEGEAREVGRILGSLANECYRRQRPFRTPCVLVGCGGEATVSLPAAQEAALGLGGPNQETALSTALGLRPSEPIAIACIDTDGSDGSSLYAGALADSLTNERANATDTDLNHLLRVHRSSFALERLGDFIVTGPTNTNVNDLFVIAIGRPA